jgi:hypothetical protein
MLYARGPGGQLNLNMSCFRSYRARASNSISLTVIEGVDVETSKPMSKKVDPASKGFTSESEIVKLASQIIKRNPEIVKSASDVVTRGK